MRKSRDIHPVRFRKVILGCLLLLTLSWSRHAAGAGISESSLYVAMQAGNLTVRAADASLVRVLQEIASQIEIRIYGEEGLANEKITIEFTDLKIQEGLAKMLAGYNAAYIYSPKKDVDLSSSHKLTEIWVFAQSKKGGEGSKGAAAGINFVQLSGKEMESPDPSIRRRAIEAISDNEDPTVIPVLLNFLRDQDQAVRLAAIYALSEFGDLVPVDQIARIALEHGDPQTRMAILSSGIILTHEARVHHALHDPSPEVRKQALQTLEEDERIEEVAREALKDPDPSVQEAAKALLQSLKEEEAAEEEEE